ncbi:TPA: phage tail protein [Citrobacter koseri]|nr:phage tail protein [Citrobacter koseri]HCR9745981.1 phage tail protein [Citrobacter koseri]HEM6684826.1 phage tail protein [Citrobacter koseri]
MSEIIPLIEESGQRQAGAQRGARQASVMMMLGDFAFSIDTTAYNQLTREASWRWSEQERIGNQDLLQYTGKPGRTVKLEGQAHAFFRKGVDAVNDLFDLADMARPEQLVSGEGDVLGWWVVTDFSDTTNRFLPGGGHRNKNWTMTLKHYADDISNP